MITAFNPIDLARILILLKLDIAALVGYTGALYQQFFGSGIGVVFTLSMLMIWFLLPLWLSLRIFKKKDL